MAWLCEVCGKKAQMGNSVETRGKAKYFSDRVSGASMEQSTEQIGGIADGVRAHRHYVPRRLSRRVVEGVEAAEL